MLNKMMKNSLAAALLLAGASHTAHAEELCALVKMEIAQEVTLERQGFEAIMRINNSLEGMDIHAINIDVNFKDAAGTVVTATSNTSSTTAAFFIRMDDITNANCTGACVDSTDASVNGASIAAKTTGEFKWLIIPTKNATDQVTGANKLYFVGATLNYKYGSGASETEETVEVAPDAISVKPLPDLKLEYFLTQFVQADDPATTSTIEEPVPYTLGVRMTNSGKGTAGNVKIDSAQPVIKENSLGLAIDFKIMESYLEDQPAAETLLINFGDMTPDAVKVGRWVMQSTFAGEFISFNASISHANDLGGQLTSLFGAVDAYFLVKDVRADAAGKDTVKDFLAWKGTDLYLYESQASGDITSSGSLVCHNCAAVDAYTNSGDGISGCTISAGKCTFTPSLVGEPKAYSYFKIAAANGTNTIDRVVNNTSGRVLLADNAWYGFEHVSSGADHHFYNIFDATQAAGTSYTIFFKAAVSADAAPQISVNSSWTTRETQQVGFLVKASDANGTIPTIYTSALPAGASFTDNRDGTAVFSWTPFIGQNGNHTIVFGATDGKNQATPKNVSIAVLSLLDSDGDGIPDAWEMEHFGNLTSLQGCNLTPPNSQDSDGDGISDCAEFIAASNPKSSISVTTDYVVMMQDQPVSIDVAHLLANDVVVGGGLTPVITAVTANSDTGAPVPQALALSAGIISYQPASTFTGADHFNYTVAAGGVNYSGRVNIKVIAAAETDISGSSNNELIYSVAGKKVLPNGGNDKVFGADGIDNVAFGHGMGNVTLYTTGDTGSGNAKDIITLAVDVEYTSILLERQGSDLALTLSDSYKDTLTIRDFYTYGIAVGERPASVVLTSVAKTISLAQVWAPDIAVRMQEKDGTLWAVWGEDLAGISFNPSATGQLNVTAAVQATVCDNFVDDSDGLDLGDGITADICGLLWGAIVAMDPENEYIGSRQMTYTVTHESDTALTYNANIAITIVAQGATLQGTNGIDILVGVGNTGIDTLAGLDEVITDSGEATIHFGLGDGGTKVVLSSGDVLKFKTGVKPEDVVLRIQDADLLVTLKNSPRDWVLVAEHFGSDRLNRIEFVDYPNIVWDYNQIFARVMQGTDAGEELNGSENNDEINGLGGDDTLRGGGGNDHIYGNTGDDLIDGALGDDYLSGGEGSDTYYYTIGWGADTINNLDYSAGHNDVLLLTGAYDPDDISLDRVGNNLLIRMAGHPDDSITILDFFLDPPHTAIQSIGVGGVTWDLSTLAMADHIVRPAQAGESVIIDYESLSRNDFDLEGDQLSVVHESYGNFVGGVATDSGNMWGGRYILFTLDNASVTSGSFTYQVSDGHGHTHTGKVFINLTVDGANILGPYQANDEVIYGTNIETGDVIDAGAGNDLINPGEGADTILFGRGDGKDVLMRTDTTGSAATLKFKTGVKETDVRFVRQLADLVVKINDKDQLLIPQYYQEDGFIPAVPEHTITLSSVTFTDNTTIAWNNADILGFASNGKDSADTLNGTIYGDTIFGGKGPDVLSGMAGDDVLYGEDGNDKLYGDEGNDSLFGDKGNDILDGGAGNDVVSGGAGNDIFNYTVGEGKDIFYNVDVGDVDPETDDTNTLALYTLVNGVRTLLPQNDFTVRLNDVGDMVFTFANSPGSEVKVWQWSNWLWDQKIGVITVLGQNLTEADIDLKARTGTAANDVIYGVDQGVSRHDTLTGLAGNDTLYSLNGDDTLLGNEGDDILDAGMGEDILNGGIGSDTLTGGEHADDFILDNTNGADTITDFEAGIDTVKIDATTLDIGNDDTTLVAQRTSGGYSSSLEMAIFTANVSGAVVNASKQATAATVSTIGLANEAMATGSRKIFVVDDGTDSYIFLFISADGDNAVATTELTLLTTMLGESESVCADYFGAQE